jgi:toxin YoeB
LKNEPKMDIMFLDDAWQDYLYWQKTDKKILKRINELIKDIQRSPFEGIGKPEPLKFSLSGLWSRRINQEHRLIYQVKDDYIIVIECRYHY